MTFIHFASCAALAFGPHYIFYKATTLSESGTFWTSARAALVFAVTTLFKLILWATFLKGEEEDVGGVGVFDSIQESLKTLIGFVDIIGLYFALTQLAIRNTSFEHKIQAVGLGWALAESVVTRLVPLWFGARGLEFTWTYIIQAIESNSSLVLTVCLSGLGALMWLRKNKPAAIVPFVYAAAALIASMPFFVSYVRHALKWDPSKVVVFEVSTAAVAALVTTRLFSACQRQAA